MTLFASIHVFSDTCDAMLNDITAYLIQCSTHEIGRDNATRIAAMLRVVSEFEEATDRIYRLVKIVQRKYEKGRHFPEVQDQEIITLCAEVCLLFGCRRQLVAGCERRAFG